MKILFLLLFFSSSQANSQLALSQIKSLGMNLKKELKAAMKKSPLEAVEVCHLKAPQITKKKSEP